MTGPAAEPPIPHVVARVGKPHGLRGEVTVQVHTDAPQERLVAGAEFSTEPVERGPLVLRAARRHQDRYLLQFEGVLDRNSAELLRGTRLLAPLESPEPEDDGWYEQDVVGLRVRTVSGEDVGTVCALQPREAQDLLGVRTPGGGQVWVPLVHELVPEIDLEQGYVLIDPPDGLFDLEQ